MDFYFPNSLLHIITFKTVKHYSITTSKVKREMAYLKAVEGEF